MISLEAKCPDCGNGLRITFAMHQFDKTKGKIEMSCPQACGAWQSKVVIDPVFTSGERTGRFSEHSEGDWRFVEFG